MFIYISQRNNARFFSQFHDQLKPICDNGATPIIAYAPKKGFRVEQKTDHYSLTRLFISCCGPSYRFEDSAPPLEEMLTSTLAHRLENPDDTAQKDDLCQELINAVRVAEQLKNITGHIFAKRKEKKSEPELCRSAENESTRFHMRQFDLLQKVAELKGIPPLSVACQNGLFDMALELIDQGADIAQAHGFYDELLKAACKKGIYTFAIELIELGANPAFAEGHLTRLLDAAISQKKESAATKIINGGAPLNELNARGETCLYCAIKQELFGIASQIIAKKADVNLANRDGKTAIQLTVRRRLVELSLELLNAGATANQVYGDTQDTLFQVACTSGTLAIAIRIVQKSTDVNFKAPNGETSVQTATRLLLPTVVAVLLEKNADTSKGDSQGNTPMHVACMAGSIELVTLFQAKPTCNFAQMNRAQESPFQAGLSSPNWNTHRPHMRLFFEHFFKDIRAAKERIAEQGNYEFCKYFKRYPSLLVDSRTDGPTANPLEIPLLLQNGELLKAVSTKLTRRKFMEFVTAFCQKYPATPADLMISIYSMTRSGLTKGIEKVVIPPKPAGFNVRSLMALYDQVNFHYPSQPDYYDRSQFSKDTGVFLFSSGLKAHLETFVDRVEKKEFFLGTPRPGSQALLDFHEILENAAANICKKLHDVETALEEKRLKIEARSLKANKDDDEAEKEKIATETAALTKEITEFKKLRATTVIEFLRAAGFCGGKYMAASVQQFNRIVRNIILTFENLVQQAGGDYREILLNSLVTHRAGYGIDVHDFNQLMRAVGVELGIPGAAALAAFADAYGAIPDAYQLTLVKKKFFELYTPATFILEWLEPLIRTEVEMRDKFIDWCKNNVPADWAKERFDPIRQEVASMKTREGITEKDIETYLLKQDIYMGVVNDKKMTPEEAIEGERVGCFLAIEVVDMEATPMRIKKPSIAYMLETMGLISATFAKEPVVTVSRPTAKAASRASTTDEPPSLIKFVQGAGLSVLRFFGW